MATNPRPLATILRTLREIRAARTILCVCLSLLLAFQGCASHGKPSVGSETEEPEKRPPSPRGTGDRDMVDVLVLVIALAPVWVPIWLIYELIHKMTHKKEEPTGVPDDVRKKEEPAPLSDGVRPRVSPIEVGAP